MKLAAGILVVALAALGCDLKTAPRPAATCARMGDKCQLPDGPLGVCDSVTCKPGEAAPCLRCTPQH